MPFDNKGRWVKPSDILKTFEIGDLVIAGRLILEGYVPKGWVIKDKVHRVESHRKRLNDAGVYAVEVDPNDCWSINLGIDHRICFRPDYRTKEARVSVMDENGKFEPGDKVRLGSKAHILAGKHWSKTEIYTVTKHPYGIKVYNKDETDFWYACGQYDGWFELV